MNNQVLRLVEQGYSHQQVAEQLGITLQDVTDLVTAKPLSLEEQLEAAKPAALRTVIDIAKHGESEIARLKAAQIILTTESRGPKDNDRYATYFEKMKRVLDAHKLIEV